MNHSISNGQQERAERLTTPDWMPPAPKPAIALPTMKAIELGADPQTVDPTSNSTTAETKVTLVLRKEYNFPNTNREVQFVSK
jgi:hypothetical protein